MDLVSPLCNNVYSVLIALMCMVGKSTWVGVNVSELHRAWRVSSLLAYHFGCSHTDLTVAITL